MNEHERIASEIFLKYGLDFKTAIHPGGWTNAVWLNGDLALRLSLKKDSDRIRQEVKLSKCLPTVVGYPVNVATGVADGYEWSLSKRIDGNNLSGIWMSLNWKERYETIRQIFEIIQALHTVDTNKIGVIPRKRAWYMFFDAQETYLCMERYVRQKIFSVEQAEVLCEILERFWVKHNITKPVLNHGDITTDNLLWSNGHIVSLMDFEHYVVAPPELDLHSLINLAFFSDEGDYLIDYRNQDSLQYKNDVIELLKPMLDNPDCIDLILGYAILFRLRFIEFWIANPEGELHKLDAYKILLPLANREGGFLYFPPDETSLHS